MKKRIALVLALVFLLALTSCAGPAAEVSTTQVFDQEELRQKFPEYFDLNTAKGLEVYVWQLAENSYSCGVLPGTNRNKTNEEIWGLMTKSASIEEMKAILSTYDIPDENIAIIPCVQPISSYFYPIDEQYTQAVTALFE